MFLITFQTLEMRGSLHTDDGGARSCSFSGNSELIAVACNDENVFVWNVETLQLVAYVHLNPIHNMYSYLLTIRFSY